MVKNKVVRLLLMLVLIPVSAVAEEWEDLNNQVFKAQSINNIPRALVLAEQSLNLATNSFGALDPKTLTSMSNLATLYFFGKQYRNAEIVYLETLKLRKRVLGNKHLSTVASINNLARFYFTIHSYKKAEPLYVRLLALTTELSGKSDLKTIDIVYALAVTKEKLGKLKEAKGLYVECLRLRIEVLGNQHPDTIASMNNLALMYYSLGQYEKAEPLYLQTLSLRKKLLGDKHRDTFVSMNNLGMLYYSQGLYDKAKLLFINALEGSKALLGEHHANTLSSMNNLAVLYEAQGHYEKAEQIQLESLVLKKRFFGKRHPNTLIAMNNLASLYALQAKHKKSESVFSEVLAIKRKVLGNKHPETLTGITNLAAAFELQGNYSNAEPLFIESLATSREVLGEHNPDTLDRMRYLALLYINTKQWDKADALLLEHFQLNSKFLQQVLWGVGEKTRTSYIHQQESNKNTYFNFYSMEKSAFAAERALNVSMGLKGLQQRINDEINELSSDYRKSDKQIAKLNEDIFRIEKQVVLMSASDKHDGKQDLHEQLNTLQRKLASKVITYRHKTADINYQQLMNMLSEKQAVIDFVIYREADFKTHLYKDEQLVALVAIPKKGIELVKLGGLMPVTDLIQILRNTIGKGKGKVESERQSARLIKARQALYKKLWQPLEKHLQGKKDIYVIPDGALQLLSFEQLEDDNGRKLNEAITLFQLKSVYDLKKTTPAT